METRIFDIDAPAKRRKLFHYDHQTDDFYIETVEDVEDVTEMNKGIAQLDDGNWKGDWHHVAQIPATVWADLQRRGIAGDDKALRRWLDDRDQSAFRTKPGKLSR